MGAGGQSLLGRGNGRSYGDQPLNDGERLVDMRGLDRFVAFDHQSGILTCEAGLQLADILAVLCQAENGGSAWFLPVAPGTRYVTVGGAIANDVHGKNHHCAGTFGRHVLSFDLARSDGLVLTCTPHENAELFAATIGGMGLTGLILRATVQLRRVVGLALEAEDIRFDHLDEFFDLAKESDQPWEYTVAWIDSMASGRRSGRGIFSRARHTAAPGRAAARQPKMTFPPGLPMSLATPATIRAFNALYVRKLGSAQRRRRDHVNYEPVLFPLDAIGAWNRLYGRPGFFQFQGVVPAGLADAALRELLAVIEASGQGSFLAVMKLFGDLPSPGLLSFPMRGATLALDLPDLGEPTRQLMARLEQVVIAAQGRIYAAKDGLMKRASMEAGYPALDRFRASIDPAIASDFARRTILPPPLPA